MIHFTHQPGSQVPQSILDLVEMIIGHSDDTEDGHDGIDITTDSIRYQLTTHTTIVLRDGDLDGIAGADHSTIHGIITHTVITIVSTTTLAHHRLSIHTA